MRFLNQIIKNKLSLVPKQPGCYIMKDMHNNIIYVGKAKNLANRVRSYFTGSHDAKTTKMISQVHDFEYIITATETEAFVLENNLIKEYNPKYNIMLTDDKTYPYICITNETHPRIIYTREVSKKLGKYYGPYPNAKAAKEMVNLLNRLYPLRKCTRLPKKECLYYHLGQCLAPCIKNITANDYEPILGKIHQILRGNIKDKLKELESLMLEAAEKLEFEKAIEYRNLINDLNSLQEEQNMDSNLVDCDIFGYYEENNFLSIQIFHIRNGKMIQRNGFLYELFGSIEENFINFIVQFYLNNNNPLPQEIIIPAEIDGTNLKEFLQTRITNPKRGQKKELVELVKLNAKEKINELLYQQKMVYERTLGAIIELGNLLNIPTPHIIEAFDNSNIQGYSPVSAMVVFIDGKPKKSLYRKYRIKTVAGPNDYQTMYEVIKRRYLRLKNSNEDFPNLIVVDGGQNQVNAAKTALEELEVNIPILGLVKDENHKTNALFFNDKTIDINKRSGLFHFLENLQNEVHRYAITFHHQVHSKNILSSKLDDIPGIGKVKKSKILRLLTDEGVNIESLRKLNLTEEQINEVLKLFSSDR